ncbi:DUF6318 family protein [Modestobacter versicolor]|uniref:DUF6318 family protein n=1 Tax=Modestobacter versicolor TaxID=429133 RepID=UPI0034DDF878
MRLVRVAAATATAVVLLAGCSDGGTANETLPSTSSTAAETTESLPPLGPPDLPMPDEARQQTPAGAEAFLQYFIQLMNAAQEQATSEYVRSLSLQCATCDTFADGVDNYAKLQYRYDGGEIVLGSVSAPSITGGNAEFALALVQDRLSVIGPDGSPIADLVSEAANYPASGAIVTWDSARETWLMTTLTIA